VISPESHELPELVRHLHQQGTCWLPAGLGSRLDWGAALSQPCEVLSCARLQRILDHNPGDFTISVEAGTPLADVQAALAEHRQWLALDPPWGEASGSIGGLVARGLAGGYRQRHMGVRDQLIGIGLIRADGVQARAGGKVVKNVAGYDLMRLLTGSWGSLGLITELTLRTLPLPLQRRGVVVQGPLPALADLTRWLLGSGLSPERIDWWNPRLAARAGFSAEPLLLIGLASVDASTLEAQAAALGQRSPLPCHGLDAEALRALLHRAGSAGPTPAAWLLRLGVAPDQGATLLAEPTLAAMEVNLTAGSGLGMAWGSRQSAAEIEALRRRCQALGGHLTVLLQPADANLPAWEDAPSRPLIEAVKRQFDPKLQLAPGRLPGVASLRAG
jgi:glycolate oxidase FAD binding subunit